MDRDGDPLFGWLGPAAEVLRGWADHNGFEVELCQPAWYAEGYSGARLVAVILANRTGPRNPRKVIVKYCPPGASTPEGRHHRDAFHSSPRKFSNEHLVELKHDPIPCPDAGSLLIQDLADGDLDSCSTLADLDVADLAKSCKTVVRALLLMWNPEVRIPDAPVTPAAYLRRELRGEFAEDGELRRVFTPGGLLDARRPWLSFDDRILPNPVLLADRDPTSTTPAFRYVAGRCHGDLHGGNVLVSFSPNRQRLNFRLVDLSDYDAEASLSRDVATLLVAVLCRRACTTLMPAQRSALASYVLDAAAPTKSFPAEWTDVVDAFRPPDGAPFLKNKLQQEWNRQLPLSIMAAGLRHAAYRTLRPDVRHWSLEIAATAAGHVYSRYFDAFTGAPPPGGADAVADAYFLSHGATTDTGQARQSNPDAVAAPREGIGTPEMYRLIEAACQVSALRDKASFDRFLQRMPRRLVPPSTDAALRKRWHFLFHQFAENPRREPWRRFDAALLAEFGNDPHVEHLRTTMRTLKLIE